MLRSRPEENLEINWSPLPRRTPRKSLVVILPEKHIVSADSIAAKLDAADDYEVDVIVACAGQPIDLNSLHGAAPAPQFILAPAGTTSEQLRELAMTRASGDIVTLVTGQLAPTETNSEQELLKTS